jgi:hypothetical protein
VETVMSLQAMKLLKLLILVFRNRGRLGLGMRFGTEAIRFVLWLKVCVILGMFLLLFGLLMLLVFSLFMLFLLMLTKGVYILVEVKFDYGFFFVLQFIAFGFIKWLKCHNWCLKL